MAKSIFSSHSEDEATHGIDNILGSDPQSYSHMPEILEDENAPSDKEMGTEVDDNGKDADQPVAQIKRALDEKQQERPDKK